MSIHSVDFISNSQIESQLSENYSGIFLLFLDLFLLFDLVKI